MPAAGKPPHLFAAMLARVHAASAAVLGPSADLSRVVVEPPRDPTHGDMATNAAMVLAKDAGKKPRELAEAIAAKLRAEPTVETVSVAGPGFINLTLKSHVWAEELRVALAAGADYGRSDIGKGDMVNVEYVSANPTGPMHIGHGRGAVFGDALASLLEYAGYAVTREYYINDAGAQVDVLARSAYLALPRGARRGHRRDPGGALSRRIPAPCRRRIGRRIRHAAHHQAGSRMAAARARQSRRHDDGRDPRRPRRAQRAFRRLLLRALADRGRRRSGRRHHRRLCANQARSTRAGCRRPKGSAIEDWEDREQTLFRSTDFGDDVDRPLKKSDGSYTYFASDIAYHKSKVERGFRNLIDVWGADHGGYIKRMQAAVKAVSGGKAQLDVKLVQLVKLLRAGEPVKMSKRAGDFVTLREVVDEVGRDAVRFDMLYRKNDAVLDFDLAKVIEASRENPVFYVQYGHARGQSVFRNARAELPDVPDGAEARARWLKDAPLERLSDAGELAILRRIALFPRTVEAAAAAHEPHRIAFYLYELASEFHALWTRGKDLPYLRFIIQNDPETTKARLALVQGVVTVLACGLAVLGVEAPQEMR